MQNKQRPHKHPWVAWFDRQSQTIRSAIIGGIFVLAGTIVTGICGLLSVLFQIGFTEIVEVAPSSTSSPASTSGAFTLTFRPVADVSIAADLATSNFGSATTLEVDNAPVVSFLLKFNVMGVEGGKVINAKLRLYSVDDSDFGGYFYRITDNSWCEGSVTYDTAPPYDSSTIVASLQAVSIDNWYEVDMTSLVTGDGTYGIWITSVSGDGADYISKEGANPPQLAVTYLADENSTPIPAPTSTATPSPLTVVSSVNCSTDDAEEYVQDNSYGNQGDVDVISSDLEMIYEYGPQLVGVRFNGIMIPKGATITSAYIEFVVDETGSSGTDLTIRGEASDNAATFASANSNISARERTESKADWFEIPEWTVINEKWKTPDLSNVIQEIVNRPGWASGNSLVIIINGDGTRTARSFDITSGGAPKLVITYTP